ncbi:WD40 repeat-like protein, partial [Rhizopogon salebrosus TDB-379]
RQWDLQAGMELEEVRDTCDDEVRAVAVSRNGRWVITVTNNHDGDSDQVKACEVKTGIVKILNTDRLPLGGLECIDISADNTLLTSGSIDGTVWIWNLDTGKLVAGPLGTDAGHVGGVRFSQDSKKLTVVASDGNCLEVWDLDASTSEPVGAPFKRHIKHISGLALTSDGALLASASFDNTIKFWAFESRQ